MVAEANAAGRHGTSIDPAQLAQWSFRMLADAMLRQRRRGSDEELARHRQSERAERELRWHSKRDDLPAHEGELP